MNEFDDPQIERLLGGAGGAFPDVNVAYGQVSRRVRQVKRRRVMVAGSAACVALFAGVAFAVRDGAQAPGLQPADSFDGTGVSIDSAPDDSLPSDSTLPDDSAPDTSDGASAPGNSTSNSTGTSGPPGNSTVTTVGASPQSSAPASTPTTPATTPTTPATTPPPAPVITTFSGVGGSITVRLESGALTLVSSNAAGGFTGEVKVNRGDRIEVIFDNGDHETKIRVDVVGSTMVPDISEN